MNTVKNNSSVMVGLETGRELAVEVVQVSGDVPVTVEVERNESRRHCGLGTGFTGQPVSQMW